MNVKEFFNKYNGQAVDKDGYYGAQCMDLYNTYQEEVIGIKAIGASYAKDIWNRFDNNAFTRIANTLTFVPKIGDVAVWGISKATPYGHVAICTGNGNMLSFESFDQNWCGMYAHYVKHNYFNGFLGVLRPNKNVDGDLQYRINVNQGLNLRSSHSTTAKILTALPLGTVIKVTDIYKGQLYTWGKTIYNGQIGWVALSIGAIKI